MRPGFLTADYRMDCKVCFKRKCEGKLCRCDSSLSDMGGKTLHGHVAGKNRKKRFMVVLLLLDILLMQDVFDIFVTRSLLI